MDQTKSIKLQKKHLESAEERRARLDKANERARVKRRMETEEQKKNEARKGNARATGPVTTLLHLICHYIITFNTSLHYYI